MVYAVKSADAIVADLARPWVIIVLTNTLGSLGTLTIKNVALTSGQFHNPGQDISSTLVVDAC